MEIDHALECVSTSVRGSFERGVKGVVDELTSRRCRFRSGTSIRLADDQEWVFPAPTADPEFAVESAGVEYLGLIRAVQEAEDQNEARLAELALAIYLIELNYELGSAELASLFTFPPRSKQLAASQHAFESLAREHVLAAAVHERLYQRTPSSGSAGRQIGQRIASWLRDHGILPKSLPGSRKGEVLS